MIDPEDIPFEVAEGGGHSLAPRYRDRTQKRAAGKDEAAVRRGTNNRKRGAAAERRLRRLFEDHGWDWVGQGGPGRRDAVVMKEGRVLAVECKSHKNGKPTPGVLMAAYRQAERQADGKEPLACVWCTNGSNRGDWTFVGPDGYMPAVAWFAGDGEPIPLGRNE